MFGDNFQLGICGLNLGETYRGSDLIQFFFPNVILSRHLLQELVVVHKLCH